MKKLNLKGVTAEAVTGIALLVLALINAVLQMFGMNVLPIQNDDISNIVSVIFLIVTAAWNTWKNRNFTKASQEAQALTDMIKDGKIFLNWILFLWLLV